MGLASTYSFYPAKMLGAPGDGGAVLTDSDRLAADVHRLRDHGRVTKTEVDGWGATTAGWTTSMQPSSIWRLAQLPRWIDHRRKLASIYDDLLSDIDELDLPIGPDADPRRRDVYQNYTVMTDRRDELVLDLNDDGIEVLVVAGAISQSSPAWLTCTCRTQSDSAVGFFRSR